MITDPKFAPQRSDLTYLRRRSRPKQQAQPAAPTTPASPSTAHDRINYTRRDRTPPVAPPSVPTSPAPAAPAAGGVDYRRHDEAPAAPPAPAAQPTRQAQPTRPAQPASSGSLDLSDPAPAASAQPATPRRRVPAAPEQPEAWRQRHIVRVGGRQQRIMSVQDPTVTLTRVQSGIGQLMIEAMCSADVGDLRLGAAYQLRSGGSGIVAHADGSRFGPSSRRPVLAGSREEYERIGVDLRQITDIERLAVFAYSESRTELTWGGTLVATLDGGARLELPLERLYAGRIAMLMTLYNMDGELVVRAELETIAGDVREAARAYGFDRITWRDDRNPVD